MVFPVVATEATSSENTNTTSHTVSLPSGIVSGDLLIAIFAVDDAPTITWPAGWTQFASFLGADSRVLTEVAYRQADGTEGASITVTTSVSEGSAHHTLRITGAEPVATQPPEDSPGASGNSGSPDPDSLTPTSGAKDYLWIAVAGIDNSAAGPISAFPSSYTNGTQVTGDAVGRVNLGTARRNLNAVSEDPGSFTHSPASRWGAGTLAIHPVTVVPPAPVGDPNLQLLLFRTEWGDYQP